MSLRTNVNPKTDLAIQAKLARRAMRRMSQMVVHKRISLAGVPVFFANSFPKSGTHLLTQVLQGFSRIGPVVDSGLPAIVTFEGESGQPRPPQTILMDLQRLLPGDLAYGHLHAFPAVQDYFAQDGFVSYFILRDPRDIVVSHVHYITEMEPNHVHHDYYRNVLTSFDERLRASIIGRPEIEILFPNIYQRFEPYTGWLDHPQTLVLRFEDFIQYRKETLNKILDHAVRRGFPLRSGWKQAIRTLEESINPERSPTFRKGKVGGWREQFSSENKQIFKEVAGDLLIQLGYEQDHDW